jgi:hypothetical protein
MKASFTPQHLWSVLITLFLISQLNAQVSPWGTGSISNLSLDTLNGQSVYISHTSDIVNTVFDLNDYLANYTFDVYIPASYDGTKPYGLVTFINSGNTGGLISSWVPVLDEKNLILIAGDNIGNSVSVVTRIGVAFAGAEKLKEALNIDTSRVYVSGNSGGARSCGSLIFFFPEKFQGMLANCGSSYLRLVDQDYETHQPNSHYEYGIFPFDSTHLEYVHSFDRRYAMMTSYDDFREGDIMNIYHNGMEPDGFKAKILEVPGPHCATSTDHFRDAVNFVEHPHIHLILDSFHTQPIHGHGFKKDHVFRNPDNQLEFYFDLNDEARAYSKDPFIWNEFMGAIFRTSIAVDSSVQRKNAAFTIGILDFEDLSLYGEELGPELYPSKPNYLLSVSFIDSMPRIHIVAESPFSMTSNDTLFSGKLADWSDTEALDLKFHLWNQELRIELGNHLDSSFQVGSMTKVLDDYRSIRIRTDNSYWDLTDYNKGSLLTFTANKLDTSLAAPSVKMNYLELLVADSLSCKFVDQLIVDSVLSCQTSYDWVDGNTYTVSNNSAVYHISNPNGCDSLLELHLEIDTIDVAVTQNGLNLLADEAGASYQWINCVDMMPIVGATNRSFEVTAAGDYAVVLNKHNCTDTSACISITGLGTSFNTTDFLPKIYPNPSKGNLTLDLGERIERGQIEISDISGRVIQTQILEYSRTLDFNLTLPKAVYFMKIKTEKHQKVLKLIIH